jgi:hypothetical protein
MLCDFDVDWCNVAIVVHCYQEAEIRCFLRMLNFSG